MKSIDILNKINDTWFKLLARAKFHRQILVENILEFQINSCKWMLIDIVVWFIPEEELYFAL